MIHETMVMSTPAGTEATPNASLHTSINGRSVGEIVFICFLVGIIQLAALFGNAIVIACVYNYHRLRSEVGSVFIVNLGVTDMMSSVVVINSSFLAVACNEWNLGPAWCDIVCCMNYTLIIVSMLTLCFISMDRYMAVVYALRYQILMTKKIACLLIAWAWFQGFTFGLAPVFMGWVEFDYWELVCAIQWHVDSDQTLIYVTMAFILCFFLPGIVLCIFYCKVMSVAKAHSQHRNALLGTNAKVTYISSTSNNRQSESIGMTPNPDIRIHVDGEDSQTGKLSVVSGVSKIRIDVKPVDEISPKESCDDIHIELAEKTVQTQPNRQNPTSYSNKGLSHQDNYASQDLGFKNCSELETTSTRSRSTPGLTSESSQRPVENECEDLSHSLHFSNKSLLSSSSVSAISSSSCLSQFSSAVILQPNPLSPQPVTPTKMDKRSSSIAGHEVTVLGKIQNKLREVNLRQTRSKSVAAAATLTTPTPSGNKRKKINYSASSKALRSLLIVVLAYFICMTPFSVTKLYKVIVPSETALPGYINVVASIFQYCSSAINPLIYGIFRKDFQLAFRTLLKKLRLSNNDVAFSHTSSFD